MRRSFSLVDHKVAEAAFFLEKIPGCGYDFFGVRCYVSAFVSSTRSITFALQSVLNGLDGFAKWYESRRKELRNDPLARFFHEFRRVNQHIGENLVGGGSGGPDEPTLYWFTPTTDVPDVPSDDVYTACQNYMVTITSLVYDCYIEFGPHIDAHQRYTEYYFHSIGKTITDAEEEIGFPHGWTDTGDSDSEPYRWQLIRDNVAGCEI
ncbi:MAG: hypothetical protein IID46_09335, partial [Planctomycetes bacterium]|nr:hypothetical protein [Planctomycetota bacterium]